VAGGEALLASIVSVDPIHVLFDVDEPTYLRLLAARGEGDGAPLEVAVGLAGEPDFPRRGQLDFLDNQADRATSTARLRAVLPNPDGRLAPGLFARIRVALTPARPSPGYAWR
jgi:membrane fusion protein, gold/copper resistance efflux system